MAIRNLTPASERPGEQIMVDFESERRGMNAVSHGKVVCH